MAIEQYQQAVEGAVDSAELQVELKGRLGLGLAQRLQGDAYLRTQAYDQASPVYAQAVEEIQSTLARLSPDQHRLLAQAYLGLGAAYEGQAYLTRYVQQEAEASKPIYEEARAAYNHCLEQADQSPYDDLLQKIRNFCGPYGQEVQSALDGL